MVIKRLKRHACHFLDGIVIGEGNNERIIDKLEAGYVIRVAGSGQNAGIHRAIAQHLNRWCSKGGGRVDADPGLWHRGNRFDASIASHHRLWADCRHDAKTDRGIAGRCVCRDLITHLAVHRLILAEEAGHFFSNTNTAAPARTVDNGKAKTLFNGAGALAQQVNGNAEGACTENICY